MNNVIANLTQHESTAEQKAAGVVDFVGETLAEVKKLLTFDSIPTQFEMWGRASCLAEIVSKSGSTTAMIGGAPYFMSSLEKALNWKGITALYAFSKRESREVHKDDGTVEKVAVFRFSGFVNSIVNR